MLNRRVLETKNKKVCAGKETKKGKEKTDEGSSVLLYLMTEEGEREYVCAASRAEVTLDKDVVVVLESVSELLFCEVFGFFE